MTNPIMWDEGAQTFYVTTDTGTYAADLNSIRIGPLRPVATIPETASRFEPLRNINRILAVSAVTAAVRRAEDVIREAVE